MRAEGRDGHTYLTASQIRREQGYGDITPATLGDWVRAGRLRRVTYRELAAAFDRRMLPDGVDPAAPALARGVSGPEHVYRWADIVRAEVAVRQHRRTHGGRPRTREAT